MMSARAELTPQMREYAEKFDDRGEIRWLPYLMYFHATNHRSEVVNTDALGFRIAHGPAGEQASAGGSVPAGPVRLMAGSSTVLGIGATSDAATLPSRLWSKHAPATPWLNFGGRSHNSTQELLLFTLYRHLLPKVDHIVLLSGFNDLGLSRLPASLQGDHGAFFNCVEHFEAMAALSDRHRARRKKPSRALGVGTRRSSVPTAPVDEAVPELPEQIAHAVELTTRHLATWRLLADGMGARLTYALQPLATWVRDEPAPQERRLFAELDAIADFGRAYGDIASRESGRRYSAALRDGCARIGVPFLDMNDVLADAIGSDDWLFVDRIHFTDDGYDLVAGLLAEALDL
ncbi:MAG: SGNH/GDSL hydrolase family protein [Frankiaceae bacterium]